MTAERKRVYGKRKPLNAASTSGDVTASDSSCKGKSGNVVVNKNYSYKFWNSCQTIDLEYYLGGCVASMGFVGKFVAKDPKIELPAYFIGVVCGIAAWDVSREAAKSDIGAVYLETYKQEAYLPYPGQVRYFIKYDLRPQ